MSNNFSYIINEGEDRWECDVSDDDKGKLTSSNLEVTDTTVHCDDVRDNCKVVYKLGFISTKDEYERRMRLSREETLRWTLEEFNMTLEEFNMNE